MQVNDTGWIPIKAWGGFKAALKASGLTHNVVWHPLDGGWHVSFVPRPAVVALVERFSR